MRALVLVIVFLVGCQKSNEIANSTDSEIVLESITNSIGMKLVLIPAGTFTMGSPVGEGWRQPNETPYEVTISKSYHLGVYEVTQGEYEKVMGTTPWKGQKYVVKEGPNFPATYVRWVDAVEFCERLSSQEGKAYRLPTEAEWEYACRGGTTSAYCFGDNAGNLSDYAWFDKNAGDADAKFAHEVGLKRSNSFGLHDMHGNVWEYCSDWWGDYPTGNVTDPQGPSEGSYRVCRGGGWDNDAMYCRSAGRDTRVFWGDYLGFRVAISLP